jgi:hypothetical protein
MQACSRRSAAAWGAIEVLHTDRRDRRLRGESDALDAKNGARFALSSSSTAVPKTNDGVVEMIRQIKVAKASPSRPAPRR